MSEAEVAYYVDLAKSIGLTVLLVLFVILPIEYVYERRICIARADHGSDPTRLS